MALVPTDESQAPGEPPPPLNEPAACNGDEACSSTVSAQLAKVTGIAFPLLFQNLFQFCTSIVSTAFVGHLGKEIMASVLLASSLFNVTGVSILIGLSAGMETMCGQAYGAKNYKMLGLIMQRAMIVCLLACLPVVLLWSNMGPILIAIHQDPVIAAGAATYLRLVTPALLPSVISSVLYRYLLAQNVVAPTTCCSIVAAVLCPVFNWLLITRLQLGLAGAAYANVLSQTTTPVLLILYILYRDGTMYMSGHALSTWPGWRLRKALEPKAVLQYLSYGGPAAAMICLEWWAFELIIILSGTIKDGAEEAVSTMGITFLISSFMFMFSISFSTAANTRIANELGAGNAGLARQALVVTLGLVFGMLVAFTVILWLARDTIASVFTDVESVKTMIGHVTPVLCCGVMGDGINAVCGGALRGCGRQGLGAMLNLVGWWILVVPLAIFLGLYQGLGPWGFWVALCTGSTFQAVVVLLVLTRFDWQKEVERAHALVAKHREVSSRTTSLNKDTDLLGEPLLQDVL